VKFNYSPIFRGPNFIVYWSREVEPPDILCDFTGFSIDKGWSDVIMPAYNKRFEGDIPNGVQSTRFS